MKKGIILEMTAHVLDIADEPSGACYQALLRFASKHCMQFSLVWNNSLKLNAQCRKSEYELRPYLISETLASTWPGTTTNRSALVRCYQINEDTLRILHDVDSLYAWRAPDRPEDLAFYTADGACWLATVSHEHMSWFAQHSPTREELAGKLPCIQLYPSDPLK